MTPDGLNVKLAELKGRLDGIDIRLGDVEGWVDESRSFHKEMSKRWDRFDGMQESEMRAQALRHQQNQEAIASAQSAAARTSTKQNWVIAIGGLISLLIMGLGTYIAYKEYQSHGHAQIVQSTSVTSAQNQLSHIP